MKRAVLLGGVGMAVAGIAIAGLMLRPAPTVKHLIGDDYGRMRREALALFPRGKAVGEVTTALTAMGFVCAPIRHLIANINAPSVECDSAGRNYPVAAHMELTLMARNGSLSDIAVGNGMPGSEASASNPDPPSAFPESTPASATGASPKVGAEHKAE